MNLFEEEKPDIVIHLAAQARLDTQLRTREVIWKAILSNIQLLEAARAFLPCHMLLASTSSAYGAIRKCPIKNTKADHQMSFYAATKKSTENMAHSYVTV